MRAKSAKYIILVVLLLIGTAVSASIIDSIDFYKKELNDIGSKVKNINSDEANKKIVLEIGDELISLKNFKTVGVMLKTEDKNVIADYIIERILIRKMAGEKGVTVTDEEVKEYMQETRDFINSNGDTKAKFNVYLESFEYNEEGFWTSESTFDQYKNMLIEGEFRGLLRKEFMNKYKDKAINEIEQLVTEEIKGLIEARKQNTQIEKHFAN